MFHFTDNLSSINDTTIILRLLLSVVFGGVIGFERGRAGRPAGLRTHILVCLGSALAIMTNQYVFEKYGISDPTRIAAQVVSGIGFLGAGTIIVTGRHQVKGLTTAAGLWATACMGLAIGIGFYKAALFACFLIAFATVVLHRFDNIMLSKSKMIDVYMEIKKNVPINRVIDQIKTNDMVIDSLELVRASYDTNAIATIMTIRLKHKRVRLDIITTLCAIEGVEFAEEI
jgi:Uncharacterized membrane protein